MFNLQEGVSFYIADPCVRSAYNSKVGIWLSLGFTSLRLGYMRPFPKLRHEHGGGRGALQCPQRRRNSAGLRRGRLHQHTEPG